MKLIEIVLPKKDLIKLLENDFNRLFGVDVKIDDALARSIGPYSNGQDLNSFEVRFQVWIG